MSNTLWQETAVDDTFEGDPRGWLARRMDANMRWLLAHADDGVIWGKWQRRKNKPVLVLSGDVFPHSPSLGVKLSADALQQVRLFGPRGELLLWRTRSGFSCRLIEDEAASGVEALPDQHYLLWRLGQDVDAREGFTVVQEGAQGPHHALPLDRLAPGTRPWLVVRHYVRYDDGQAYVFCSRLVNLDGERREA